MMFAGERTDRVGLVFLSLAGLVLATAGCSRSRLPQVVPAGGVITYRGAAVEGASVMFVPIGGGKEKAATAVTNASGKFQLSTFGQADGAMPGQYKVTVFKSATIAESGDIENQVDEKKVAMQAEGQAIPEVESAPLLPEKYSSAQSTVLDATVKEGGKNEFTFDLQD